MAIARADEIQAGDYVKFSYTKSIPVLTRATMGDASVVLGFDPRHFGQIIEPTWEEIDLKRKVFAPEDEIEVTHHWPEQPR